MPDREPEAGHSSRLLRGLIWAGVVLAPLAAVIVLLGQSSHSVRFAVLLMAVSVVLIGASVLIRNDPVLHRMHVEDRVADEVAALRSELRAEFATPPQQPAAVAHPAPLPRRSAGQSRQRPASGFFSDDEAGDQDQQGGYRDNAEGFRDEPSGFFADEPPGDPFAGQHPGPSGARRPPAPSSPNGGRASVPAAMAAAAVRPPAAAARRREPGTATGDRAPGRSTGARSAASASAHREPGVSTGDRVPGRQPGGSTAGRAVAASASVAPQRGSASVPTSPARAAASVRPGAQYGHPEISDSDCEAGDGYAAANGSAPGGGYGAARGGTYGSSAVSGGYAAAGADYHPAADNGYGPAGNGYGPADNGYGPAGNGPADGFGYGYAADVGADADSYRLAGGYDGPEVRSSGDPHYKARRHRPSANDTNIGTMEDFSSYGGWPDQRYVQGYGAARRR